MSNYGTLEEQAERFNGSFDLAFSMLQIVIAERDQARQVILEYEWNRQAWVDSCPVCRCGVGEKHTGSCLVRRVVARSIE